MKILAIETSCDETAISVIDASGGFARPKFKILSNVIASQVELHAHWGGVVPNLAKREHQRNLPIVLKKAMAKAKISAKAVDVIAVTVGPGLEPALWTGINFAADLNKVWGKPVVAVNHMEGHIASVLLSQKGENTKTIRRGGQKPKIEFPALALLVSGGHTELVLLSAQGGPASGWKYKIIGQTRDDAVGEAFDKVARMLGLPYPGGPEISKLAEKFKSEIPSGKTYPTDNKLVPEIQLPRPMLHSGDFDFSFSGLKTAALYLINDLKKSEKMPSGIIPRNDRDGRRRFFDFLIPSICAEFQQAAIDVLVSKTIKAAKKYKVKTVLLGGGVAANKEMREQLKNAVNENLPDSPFLVPDLKYTTDNAAMIATAAYFRALKNPPRRTKNPARLKANGNLSLK